MAFIKKIIGPDEKLIGITTVHWIYGAKGLAWMASLMILGSAFRFLLFYTFPSISTLTALPIINALTGSIFWICTGMGVVLFLFYFLMMATSEVALTSKRVIYKRGWIFVKVVEADIEEVKAANVDNGTLGRFLNYGYIFFDTRFVGDMNLPAIADPYRFVKALNEAGTTIKQGPGTTVLVQQPTTKPDEKPKHVKIQTQQKESLFDQAAPNVKVHVPKEETPHKLQASRYDTKIDTPSEAISEVIGEVAQAIPKISGGKIKPRKTSYAPFSKNKTALIKASNENKTTDHGPLLFDRDPEKYKEELRRKIKSVFTRKTS